MNALATEIHADAAASAFNHGRYARCIKASKRARWDIDADVIRGRVFSLDQAFLPDGLSKVSELPFLSAAEARLLSQVQGRTYAQLFGLVERWVNAKVLEVSRDHWFEDQTALEALIRFSDEELKHQELFRRIETMIAQIMPEGYRAAAQPNDVASFVLSKSTWSVLALTCCIELYTQQHYVESIAPETNISPLWKDVFMYHWREECQHAILDEIEWQRAHAKLSPAGRDAAVDDLIALVAGVDGILQAQTCADIEYFTGIAGRSFSAEERAALEAGVLKAYRWQYIISGVTHPHFGRLLTSMTTPAQMARIQQALAPPWPRSPTTNSQLIPLLTSGDSHVHLRSTHRRRARRSHVQRDAGRGRHTVPLRVHGMRRRVAVLTGARAALSLANGPCVVVTAKRPPMPQASVSLLGIPHDANSSFMRGAAEAPALIRQELLSQSRHLWTETGRDLAEEGVLRDLGDLRFESDNQESGGSRSGARDSGADDWVVIEQAVAEAIADGQPLISLGGDHAITHPILRAVRRRHQKLTILHFDAHPDIYHDFEGNPRSHASPFARIMEDGLADRLIQVGIRTATAHLREQAARFGVEVIEARHFRDDLRIEWATPVYISLDIDGLDPAFAPGVSHREPGGLTPRQVLNVIQSIDRPIVGADVVEYNPRCDIDFVTAPVAAKLVKEIAGMMLETSARAVR